MGIIKNIINAITGNDEKKKEKKTEAKKTTAPKITTAGPVNTAKTPVWGVGQKTSAPAKTTPAKTTKKTTSAKAPVRITASDIVTPVKKAKQEKKLSQGKGPVTSFNANEMFIDRAKKQGTARDKERAERMERVLRTNKVKSDIKELNSALDILDALNRDEEKAVSAFDKLLDNTGIDTSFRQTDEQKKTRAEQRHQEAINKLLDIDFDKVEDTYTHIQKGYESDTLLDTEAEFLQNIEVKVRTTVFDDEAHVQNQEEFNSFLEEEQKKGTPYGLIMRKWEQLHPELRPEVAGDMVIDKTAKLTGEETKPGLYMTEDQVSTYYYLLSAYGEKEALSYFETIKPKIIEAAENRNILNAYSDQSRIERIGNTLTRLELATKAHFNDLDVSVQNKALSMGMESSDMGYIERIVMQTLYGLAENAPEMALEFIPGVGKILSAGSGFVYGFNDKYAELKLNGTLTADGSIETMLTTASLQALPLGPIGSGIGKLFTKSLTRGATRSGLREVLANLAGNAVGGSVTAVTFFGIEEAADRFFMGDNSPYEVSVRNYMAQGMSEESARDKATKDTFNNMLTSAVVGSLQSTIFGFGSARKWGVDFKKAGEKILSKEGLAGIKRILDEAEGTSKKSEAWRNAQRLRRRQLQNKEIYADMLGAQEYLNSIERQRQNAFNAGITNITGIRIQRGKVDDAVNETIENGVITLSLNPDTDLVEVVKHATAHGVEGANPNTFAVYKNQLRNAPGYTEALRRMKKTREDAGLSTDKATLESEVAAEFARNFVKTVKDLDRLQRVVNGNPALADRIYIGLRDLRARMKAKGGTLFVDEATGIKIRYDELNTLTNLYEGMLLNTRESFFSDSSPMHHVKQNNDARNFGVAIHTELAGISNRRMSGMWKNNRDEVKELIRDAYRSYKKGDTETGDKLLDRAGAIWSASLKKGGTADAIDEFTSHFKKQYNDGEALKKQIERNKQIALDLENHNMNIGTYVKGIMSDIGVAKGRTNPDEEAVIREAFDNIKNNDEDGARDVLYPFAEDLFKKAKKGLEGHDSEFLNFIRTARIKLDRNGEGGEDIARLQKVSRGTYNENSTARTPDSVLEELKALFPEYPWTRYDETEEAPVTEIMRIYDLIRDGADRPKYNPSDVPKMAAALVDEIITSYRNNTPAAKETENAVRMSDEANYGMDIEGGIRELDIEGLKERDVKECAENIRRSIDDITGAMDEGIKSGIVNSAVTKFDELSKDMMDTISKELMSRGYTADDAEAIAMYMFRAVYETTENRVNRYIKEADDTLAAVYGKEFNPQTDDADTPPEQPMFDIYRDEKKKTADRAKSRKESASEAKKKLSSIFENTAKKEFFEGTESELNSRINDFMYESVGNREIADAATEYVKEKGISSVYRELATLNGPASAFDTAKAWALAVEYRKRINAPETSPEAKTRYSRLMVDVLAIMREKWTEAGQATQAIKLFNLLTLEGQLMEFKRRADAGVEAQLRKRPDYAKVKAEEIIAKRKDRARKASEETTDESDTPRKPRKKKEKTPQSELEKLYDGYGITYIPEEVYKYAQDTLKAIDDAANEASAKNLYDVINIIMDNSRKRKTRATKGTRKRLYAYHESETKLAGGDSTKPFEVLVNTARQQVFGMIDDALPKSVGRKWSSVQAMGMLNNPTTFLRNVISNFALSPMETITNDLAILPDLFMSIFTGRRTVGFELPLGLKSGGRRSRKAALEQNLKVNTFIDSEGGFSGKGADRVHTSRLMSKLEELTGYNLTVTDEFQKGIIERNVEHSLERITKKGHLTPEEVAEIIAKEIKYRTFQDDTMLGEIIDRLKKAFNLGRDFGAGDFIVKFTKVPGAVITRNLEYSPAGYVKFIWTASKTVFQKTKQKRKMTAAEQREIALTLARPTTSLGIIATGALLASKGIIVGSDVDGEGDDEYLLKKFRQVTGAKGYKLNWDALCRLVKGEDTEIQNGDRLFEISWAPFAPQLLVGANIQRQVGYDFDGLGDGFCDWWASIGYMLNPLNAKKVATDTVDYTLEQMSELPALQGIRDVAENWEYKTGYVDFAAQTVTDWGLSFEPQMLRKLGNALDPKVRDPYHGESTWERAWQKIEANLPVMPLRENVPEQIDVFGEPVSGTLGSRWKDVLNEMLSPARMEVFEESGLMEELDILYQYNNDALLSTPRTTGNVATVADRTVRFNLYGEDYEEYSKWLGTTTVRNITEFMKSDYYRYLPYYQRANAVAEIKKESEEACRTAWAEKLCEADEATQTEILEAGIKGYQQMAENMVYINQATEHVKSDGIRVETVVDCYYEREFTQEELKEEISAAEADVKQHEKILKKLHAGNGYKMVDAGNGKSKRKYTREMTPEEKAFTIRERENEIEKAKQKVEDLKAGKILAKVDIVGEWSDLPKEHQKIVLEQISKHPDKTVYIPDELMLPENLIDFSDAEPPEDDAVIDITGGYSREKLLGGDEMPLTAGSNDSQQASSAPVSRSTFASGRKISGRGGGYYNGIETADAMTVVSSGIGHPGNVPVSFTGEEKAFKHPFKRPFKFKVPFKDNKPPFIYPFDKV